MMGSIRELWFGRVIDSIQPCVLRATDGFARWGWLGSCAVEGSGAPRCMYVRARLGASEWRFADLTCTCCPTYCLSALHDALRFPVVLSSAPSVRESCELFEGLSSIRDWPTGRDTSSSHHHQEEPPIGSTHRNTEAPVSLPHSSQQDSTQRTGLAATEQQPPAPEPSAAAAAAALYASAAPAGRMSPVAHHGARPGQRSSPGSNTMAAVGPSQGSSPGGGEAKERARKQLPPVPFALAAVSDPKSASPEQRVMRSNGLRALLGSDWAGAAEGRDLLG